METLYSPPPQKIAMLRSATFAFSCKRATFATERNFRATLAQFGLFLRVSSILGTFGGKMEPLSTHNLSFPKFVAVCPKIATSRLPTFFTLKATGLYIMARLMTWQACSVACSIGYHFVNKDCFQIYLTFALYYTTSINII